MTPLLSAKCDRDRFFEQSSDVLAVLDEAGNFVRVSAAGVTLMRRPMADIEGHSLESFVNACDRATFADFWRSISTPEKSAVTSSQVPSEKDTTAFASETSGQFRFSEADTLPAVDHAEGASFSPDDKAIIERCLKRTRVIRSVYDRRPRSTNVQCVVRLDVPLEVEQPDTALPVFVQLSAPPQASCLELSNLVYVVMRSEAPHSKAGMSNAFSVRRRRDVTDQVIEQRALAIDREIALALAASCERPLTESFVEILKCACRHTEGLGSAALFLLHPNGLSLLASAGLDPAYVDRVHTLGCDNTLFTTAQHTRGLFAIEFKDPNDSLYHSQLCMRDTPHMLPSVWLACPARVIRMHLSVDLFYHAHLGPGFTCPACLAMGSPTSAWFVSIRDGQHARRFWRALGRIGASLHTISFH